MDDHAVASLASIAANIAAIDLAGTPITDAACQTLAQMPRLVSLDLRRTQIGDHGVAALAACTELRTLNLYATKVGDYGAAALAKLTKLDDLYLWQTEVSAGAIVRLKEALPDARIVVAADLPPPMTETPGGKGKRK